MFDFYLDFPYLYDIINAVWFVKWVLWCVTKYKSRHIMRYKLYDGSEL